MCVYTINEIAERVRPIADKYGIEKVYLFGSYARGEADDSSDVDMYIPILPNGIGIKYFGMYDELVEALNKNIDIVTDKTSFLSNELKNRFLKNLDCDKVKIYG